jgi:hypothetical protein
LVGSCLGAMGSLWSNLFKKFLLSRIGSRRISPSCQSCCGSHKQQSRQPMFKTSGFGFFPYASCGVLCRHGHTASLGCQTCTVPKNKSAHRKRNLGNVWIGFSSETKSEVRIRSAYLGVFLYP